MSDDGPIILKNATAEQKAEMKKSMPVKPTLKGVPRSPDFHSPSNPDPEKGIRVTGRSRKYGKTYKRLHGGSHYGAAGAIAPGAMEWKAGNEMGPFNAKHGLRGGSKKRKSGKTSSKKRRKGGKSSLALSRRRMRGGGAFGATSAEFRGDGYRGIPNYHQGNTKGPIGHGMARHGAFNDNGGKPGILSSFKGLFPTK
jgi:hypothetical protein